MNNLAELLVRNSPTPERLHQAEDWAKQAKGVIDKTRELVGGKSASPPTCEETLAAVLFNIGSLREVLQPFPPVIFVIETMHFILDR
jgi:hypothetical protein